MADFSPNLDFTTRYTGGVTLPGSTQANFAVYAACEGSDLQYVRTGGTTAERPADPPAGHTYYDTDLADLFTWNGSAWVQSAPGLVSSVFGRPGPDIVAALDDYATSDIDNDTALPGAQLSDVLVDLADLDNSTTSQTAAALLVPDGGGGVTWRLIAGTTAERPVSPQTGWDYWDTTLARSILWQGSKWIYVDDGSDV